MWVSHLLSNNQVVLRILWSSCQDIGATTYWCFKLWFFASSIAMNPPLWPVRCCWLAWKDGQKHGRSLGIGRLAETRVAQLEATAGVSPQVEAYNAVIRTGALQRCMWVEECFWTNFKDVEDEMLSLIQSSFLSPFLEISLLFILLFFPIFCPIDCPNQSHFFVVGLSARSYAEASSLATLWSACWCFFFDSLKYSYAQVGDSNSASQWLARCAIETTCICGSGKRPPTVTYTTDPHLLRNRITVYLVQ